MRRASVLSSDSPKVAADPDPAVPKVSLPEQSQDSLDYAWSDDSSRPSFRYMEKEAPLEPETSKIDETPKKARGFCFTPASSSHTHFFREKKHVKPLEYERITREQYLNIEESISGSSDTFQCDHRGGKQYTEPGMLKRNLIKNLDPIQLPGKWSESCAPCLGWDMAEKLVWLVKDDLILKQVDRLADHLKQFASTAANGFRVDVLESVCTILDFLVERHQKNPALRDPLEQLLKLLEKPILLTKSSDVITYLDSMGHFIGFLGYLLLRLEDDGHFELVSRGLLWQLSSRKSDRRAVRPHVLLAVGAPLLTRSCCRMLALTTPRRFATYLQLALILAVDSEKNCIEMAKENIFENLFGRFNPYFPDKSLPRYEINPAEPNDDMRVKLGECTRHLGTTMSLLLVLLKSIQDLLAREPEQRLLLPYPDEYSLSCYMWAFRYECQARDHKHQRNTMVVITMMLLDVFRDRLSMLGCRLMPDPCLDKLRARWSTTLFAEIKRTALQGLVMAIPYLPFKHIHDAKLLRRLMWYIEWYTFFPYEVVILYWAIRLLQTALYPRHSKGRRTALKELFDFHGVIVLVELSNKLLVKGQPPVEKTQAVIGLTMRIYTSALVLQRKLTCSVYSHIAWPDHLLTFGTRSLKMVLYYLTNHYIISDRWLVQLLNLIWESIIWEPKFQASFIENGGVYELLDLITLTDASVQCLGLALVCDLTRTGKAVAQLVTWRACSAASTKHPNLVKRGATIAALLAAVFRDDCKVKGVRLDDNGVIEDLGKGIMPAEMWSRIQEKAFYDNRSQPTLTCFAAADLCGSRMSKAHALLQLLSDDLAILVNIADERYNLYKNIVLAVEDQVILVLVSHYLTFKQCETWQEIAFLNPGLVPDDEEILEEFIQIKEGWALEIRQLQMDVLQKDRQKEAAEEDSLYWFLGRVRLNTALDALKAVKCFSRTANKDRIAHVMLHDAVRAYHRRSAVGKKLLEPIVKTYQPMLDDQNVTGQYLSVRSINANPDVHPLNVSPCSSPDP